MPDTTKKTALLAEDSISIRRFVEIILKNHGLKVLTAEDGREALKIAFENDVDIVIADALMPNLGGAELFRILKMDPEKKNIPLIMLSGLTPESRNEPVDGSYKFVPKDTSLRENLLAELDKLIS